MIGWKKSLSWRIVHQSEAISKAVVTGWRAFSRAKRRKQMLALLVTTGLSKRHVYHQLLFPDLFSFQGINFYLDVKTITSLWRDEDAEALKAPTAFPTMK